MLMFSKASSLIKRACTYLKTLVWSIEIKFQVKFNLT
jgi:hypothetical protein